VAVVAKADRGRVVEAIDLLCDTPSSSPLSNKVPPLISTGERRGGNNLQSLLEPLLNTILPVVRRMRLNLQA
jgi:hypothetical protein